MARKRHTVAVPVFDGVAPFELAVPCEVFGIDRSELVSPWYRFKVCAVGPTPVRTSIGFSIDTPYGVKDLERADTVIVPAGVGVHRGAPEPLLDALRTAHSRGARILSVCSGAFVLAEAGLLDGRRATTHWAHADELAERYPDVKVDPKVLYVDDGDILTSAGTAAGIDLCLHVVRLDHGAEVANAVARRMVVPPHRDGGQAQYVDQPIPVGPGDDLLGDLLAWMVEHLDEQLSVEDLASRAAMSPRHFARRFRAVTGTTPHQWLLSQRVLLAQRLLETSNEPIELIADRCGFGTAANLRQHFARIVGTSPAAYRRTFTCEAVGR
ncbi:MAG TPA: transcriptional regulator FtrA [Acidimicrobiales bacterium]|nr:transcriptional regulator FtrA [Acidimicrobiales bacterium]